MPGFGKHIGPAIKTPEGRVLELERELASHRKLYTEHINELIDCLFEKYIAAPDKESERLLIMHLGGKFFRKREAAQRETADGGTQRTGLYIDPDPFTFCQHGERPENCEICNSAARR